MSERVHKVVAARRGVSRREAERMVIEGRVTVNGARAAVGQPVDPQSDRIEVDGVPIGEKHSDVYLAFNKPAGVVTSRRSTHGETIVTDLVPQFAHTRPVGRLDKDTTGLLLLTSDGQWLNAITHPRYEVEKEYIARTAGPVSPRDIEQLEAGIQLPDGTITAPAQLWRRSDDPADVVHIVVREGKKRQIRHMFAATGHPVITLTRTRIGRICLGTLKVGAWRHLTPEEVGSVDIGSAAAR